MTAMSKGDLAGDMYVGEGFKGDKDFKRCECRQEGVFEVYRRPFCMAWAQLPLQKARGKRGLEHRTTPTDRFSCGESGLHFS